MPRLRLFSHPTAVVRERWVALMRGPVWTACRAFDVGSGAGSPTPTSTGRITDQPSGWARLRRPVHPLSLPPVAGSWLAFASFAWVSALIVVCALKILVLHFRSRPSFESPGCWSLLRRDLGSCRRDRLVVVRALGSQDNTGSVVITSEAGVEPSAAAPSTVPHRSVGVRFRSGA